MTTFKQALEIVGMDEGPYNQLLKALELVLGEAGFPDITWQEMGRDQHNHLSMMIGEPDIVKIARGYAGWVSMLARHSDPDGDWRLVLLADPKLNLAGPAAHVKTYLRDNQIRRDTRKYKVFLAEKSQSARATLMQLAQDVQAGAVVQLDKALAENREKLARYQGGAVYTRRCAYILRGLATVAGIEPEADTLAMLEARAERIDKAAARRAEYLDSIKVCGVEDIIDAAIRPYKEIIDLWTFTP